LLGGGREGKLPEYFSVTGVPIGKRVGICPLPQETRNGNNLLWNFKLIFLKTVSKGIQTQHVGAKKSKNFLGRGISLKCTPSIRGYITGSVFNNIKVRF